MPMRLAKVEVSNFALRGDMVIRFLTSHVQPDVSR